MSADELSEKIAALNAKIEGQIAGAQRLARESASVADEARNATAKVTSRDGRVSVIARPSGAVEAVQLSSVDSIDAESLGALITATIAAAQRAAADAVLDSLGRTLGEDSPLVAAVQRDVDEAFPAPGGPTIEYR